MIIYFLCHMHNFLQESEIKAYQNVTKGWFLFRGWHKTVPALISLSVLFKVNLHEG